MYTRLLFYHNYYNLKILTLFVLVKAPCEYTKGLIECCLRSENNKARGAALSFLETANQAIHVGMYTNMNGALKELDG